ncbi:hypothetical protein Q3G72_022454 [Acer saccharum]|nr:hypothetical protein Q3G72_022454 [Acer saccharum]
MVAGIVLFGVIVDRFLSVGLCLLFMQFRCCFIRLCFSLCSAFFSSFLSSIFALAVGSLVAIWNLLLCFSVPRATVFPLQSCSLLQSATVFYRRYSVSVASIVFHRCYSVSATVLFTATVRYSDPLQSLQ